MLLHKLMGAGQIENVLLNSNPFSGTSNWTPLNAGISESGGILSVDDNGTFGSARQLVTVTPNTNYTLSGYFWADGTNGTQAANIGMCFGSALGEVIADIQTPNTNSTTPVYGEITFNSGAYNSITIILSSINDNISFFKNIILKKSAIQPTTIDPYWSNVRLLLRCNGTNGSQIFTDESVNANSITVNGDAQISTNDVVYGTGSGKFDASGDGLQISGDFRQTSEFTIESWIKINENTTVESARLWSYIGSETTGRISFGFDSLNRLKYNIIGSSTQNVLTDPIPLNTWTHVAVSRRGSTIRGFINGALNVTRTLSGTVGNANGYRIWRGNLGGTDAAGLIDDYRFTQGVARYIRTFPPIQAELPVN